MEEEEEEETPGKLVIVAERGGTITEISQFLSDLENAYLALYTFDQVWLRRRLWRRFPPELSIELGYPFHPFVQMPLVRLPADALPPSDRLTFERVRIESPGFWGGQGGQKRGQKRGRKGVGSRFLPSCEMKRIATRFAPNNRLQRTALRAAAEPGRLGRWRSSLEEMHYFEFLSRAEEDQPRRGQSLIADFVA